MHVKSAIGVLGVAALVFLAAPAAAQDEAALRTLEGRRVVVKIDMPGTSDGVDIKADAARSIDYQRHGNRLKTYGTAIREGEAATITHVKLKKELIEIHLNGGGFGTFSDDTSTSVSLRHVDKSSREKELEKRIDDEKDGRRRKELEEERNELRNRRERENRRIDAEEARLSEQKKQRVAEQRLRGGSRFNLRYDDEVPPGLRPEDVIAALSAFIDFSPSGLSQRVALPEPPPADAVLKKGMPRADAERALGAPAETSTRREGGLAVTRLVFLTGEQRVTADFVEDVLVRYTITSR